QYLAELPRRSEMPVRGDLVHRTAHRGFHVDGRIVTAFGNPAREHDVSVEDGAGGVGDRIVLVVAFGEYGVERRDGAGSAGAVARSLHELRQAREHRGGIALGGRRLA